jgi:DNA polymerase III sliding clamp (beta) subunit (PCNA family)
MEKTTVKYFYDDEIILQTKEFVDNLPRVNFNMLIKETAYTVTAVNYNGTYAKVELTKTNGF